MISISLDLIYEQKFDRIIIRAFEKCMPLIKKTFKQLIKIQNRH